MRELLFHSFPNVPRLQLLGLLSDNDAKPDHLLKKVMFQVRGSAFFPEMGTGKVEKMIHASSAFYLWANIDEGNGKYIITLFCDKGIAIPVLNGGRYLQLVSQASQKSASAPFRTMMVLLTLEAEIFLHSLSVVSSLPGRKDCKMALVHLNETLICLCVPLVSKAGRLLSNGLLTLSV